MTLDPRLLSLLVCPLCKGPLHLNRRLEGSEPQQRQTSELACTADRLAFPVRDGIPVMLESDARSLSDDEADALRKSAMPAR